MSPSSAAADNPPRLDPSAIALAAASLVQHFQRLGIQYGPTATPAGIAQWAESFSMVEPDIESQSSAIRASEPSVTSAKASKEPVVTKSTAGPVAPRLQTVDAVVAGVGTYSGKSLPVVEREARLADLASVVATCSRCEVLAKCRTQTVFGEGSASPRVVFFGEGPGAEEDRTGRPFVGAAGQLLTKMIMACTFAREDTYILNTVKCRPPGNRNPEPGEMQKCREYFVEQLDILRPEYIVCLGAISSQALLASTLSVGRLRGKFHHYAGSKVVVTYHPAYLLRNPDAKKAAWDDLQMMLRDMGISPKR